MALGHAHRYEIRAIDYTEKSDAAKRGSVLARAVQVTSC